MKTTKEVTPEEEEAFLSSHHGETPVHPQRSSRWRARDYVRMFVEFAMACALIVLLVRQYKPMPSTIRRTPVPQRASMPKHQFAPTTC